MASRMAARTSTRSAATRDYAASPPKQSGDRQSQSPIGRRTRSTRSQSIDLGDSDSVRSSRGRGRRGARQASVESVDSNASGVSSKAGRSRKTRAAKASPDLSMVIEDRETGQDEEDEDEGADIDEFEGPTHRSQSPGGLSQMSGTTAMTSRSAASAMTSHSVTEIDSLDPLMVEYLPELLRSSWRILDQLAPPDASSGMIETIVKELRIIGSRTAKKLKIDEESFKLNRGQFGSDDYINPSFIQRRLFGNQGLDLGVSRPDAILYAANIATLVKSLLVNQKESRGTPNWLQLLDTYFPEAFLGQFENGVQFGNSLLLDESFEMGLEIRTQYTLVLLLVYKEKGGEEWDPDRILLSLFIDPPGNLQALPPSPSFEDTLKHGRVKDIMRNGPENSEEQNTRVKHRIAKIRSTFRRGNDAVEVGDLVDFEALEDMFPWVEFLTQLVQWSRWRVEEIKASIEQQGGPENITRSLIEFIHNHNSQVELNYEPPPAIMEPRYPLLPPASIKPGTSGHSLYNKDAIIALEKIKRGISSNDAPPSNQLQQRPQPESLASLSANQAGSSRSQPIRTSQQESEISQALIGDDGGDVMRGTQEYLSSWESHNREKNKENRPMSDREKASTSKRSLLDRQANARKIEWDFDNSSGPSNAKRPRQEESESSESSEGAEDEDQDFQLDRRIPDPSRKTAASTARRRSPTPVRPSPSKRARVQSVEDEVARARLSNRQRAEAALQASARGSAPYDEDEDVDEDDALNTPPPSYANINAASRLAVVQAKQASRETQKRVPWSERDTQHLIDLIEDYGCCWAEISKAGRFEHDRGQVALKDKARNLKVTFLKAGNPLPQNFDKVALGRKEIESVRTVFPDYDDRP